METILETSNQNTSRFALVDNNDGTQTAKLQLKQKLTVAYGGNNYGANAERLLIQPSGTVLCQFNLETSSMIRYVGNVSNGAAPLVSEYLSSITRLYPNEPVDDWFDAMFDFSGVDTTGIETDTSALSIPCVTSESDLTVIPPSGTPDQSSVIQLVANSSLSGALTINRSVSVGLLTWSLVGQTQTTKTIRLATGMEYSSTATTVSLPRACFVTYNKTQGTWSTQISAPTGYDNVSAICGTIR